MVSGADAASRFALDVKGVDDLKRVARQEPDKAARAAAQQFEALFMQMMLKSMRDAMPQDGMLDSEQSRMFGTMLDQQFAQVMSKRGVGLSEVIARQLAGHGKVASPADAPGTVAPVPLPSATPAIQGMTVPPVEGPAASAAAAPASQAPSVQGAPRAFVDRLWPHAQAASRETGIPPQFMIAQAALESGWGRREIRAADGGPSHNLFGIKAGPGWRGAVAETPTTEYVNGTAMRTVEKFRAYGSYEEAFRDYARLLRDNPRYAEVLGAGGDASGFARGLQRAGYATDPMYAAKLERIINSSTLRSAMVG